MSTVPLPLASLLTQIQRAIDAQLYYSALAVAFTLPDVCASLEADSSSQYWATMEKYVKWFDENVAHRFKTINGRDCYYMRGGVVHRGQFSHAKSKFDRVIFLLPNSPIKGHDTTISISEGAGFGGLSRDVATGAMIDRAPTGDLLLMDAEKFCETMVDAVCAWSLKKLDDKNFQANIHTLVHLRPEGLYPLMVGFPVIA